MKPDAESPARTDSQRPNRADLQIAFVIVAFVVAIATVSAWGRPDNPNSLQWGLYTTTLGIAVWLLTLVVSWLTPPSLIARYESAVYAMLILGMLATVGGSAYSLAVLLT